MNINVMTVDAMAQRYLGCKTRRRENGFADGQSDRKREIERDRQTDRQTERERERDRQIDRERERSHLQTTRINPENGTPARMVAFSDTGFIRVIDNAILAR
jgi:hypothetical protein